MPRLNEWEAIDDVLDDLDSPAVRFFETLWSLRVTDLFLATAIVLSVLLFVCAPPSPRVMDRPGPPAPSRPKSFAVTAVDSLSHMYANSA